MPIDGEQYLITGDDCFGNWTAIATCKYYKAQKLRRGAKYRWITENGSIEQAQHIGNFELIQ